MYYLFIGGICHGMFQKGTGTSEMTISLTIDDEDKSTDYVLKNGCYIADGMPESEYKPIIKQYQKNLPTCQVCKKPIDGISTRRLEHMRASEFTYHCHGEQEKVIITDQDVQNGINIDFSVAFDKKVRHI